MKATDQRALERRARFRELARRVSRISESDRAALAAAMPAVATVDGRALSVHNTCLLYYQLGAAVTIVGGYRQWQRAGRQVRAGEHGAMIWIPTKPRNAEHQTDTDPDDDARPGFIAGTVFDVGQTDEADPCELAERFQGPALVAP